MGHPVTRVEVIGKDGQQLQSLSSDLFGWEIDAHNPATYGIVRREANVNADGVGIGVGVGGGVGRGPTPGHVTFHVEVPEDALVKAEGRGGTRVFGSDKVPRSEVELGQCADPEEHLIGLTKATSYLVGVPHPAVQPVLVSVGVTARDSASALLGHPSRALQPSERLRRNCRFARVSHRLLWLRRSSSLVARAHAQLISWTGGRIRRSFIFTGGMPLLVPYDRWSQVRQAALNAGWLSSLRRRLRRHRIKRWERPSARLVAQPAV
jgi:predicted enzyme related to lactoylglutathione lyase